MAMLWIGCGAIGEASASEAPSTPAADSSTDVDAAAAQRAVVAARQRLAAQLHIDTTKVELVRVESQTWSNSHLGCGTRSSMAMQVITPGYAITLKAKDTEYQVHVAGGNVVVCDRPVVIRSAKHRPTNARGLDIMLQQARADLAQRLSVPVDGVRVHGTQPERWSDTGLGCPRGGEQVQTGPVQGYRVWLRHAGRTYTYHTDLNTVRACPAIEAQ
jgi:hypothetical protein